MKWGTSPRNSVCQVAHEPVILKLPVVHKHLAPKRSQLGFVQQLIIVVVKA